VALGVLLVLLAATATRGGGHDLWWHLRLGQQVAETGAPPTTDSFSSTFAGQPQRSREWLGDLLIFGAFAAGGWGGLLALKLAVVAVGLTGLLLALREQSLRMERWGPSAACLAGLALVGVVLALRWRLGLTRPFMFSFCFFGVFAGLLARFDRTEAVGPLVVLAPLQLVWANLHAGAVFGPFLVGAAFIPHLFRRPEIRGRLLGLLCACAALVAVNPDGLDAYLSLLAIGPGGGDPIVGYVVEQAPLTTLLQRADQRSTVLPGAILGAVAWVALLVVPTARCVRVAIPLVTFSLLSLLYARALGFVALAAAEPVFLLLLMISRRVAIARVWLPAASAVVFGMAVVASTAWCVDSAGENWGVGEGDDRDHPAGAVAFVREAGLTGNLFNNYDIGAYLIWHAPERRVFVDGRAGALYSPAFFAEYRAMIEDADAWNAGVRKWDLHYALVRYDVREFLESDESQFEFPRHLDDNPDWALVYWDERSTVYVRRDRAPIGLVEARGYRRVRPTLSHYQQIQQPGLGAAERAALRADLDFDVALNPHNQEPRLSKVILLLGEPSELAKREAIEQLSVCVQLPPDLALEHALLGTLLAERGDTALATRHARRALALNPENRQARMLAARLGVR
jgi:hypothetical protein